ncbi:phosphatase [Streptomyces sp. NRRL F-4489]|uniref:metallophosphoesterase n=1 Tax=Streptomyces sp. NRRL F-4489 TaxID=1609095 RepID=UPI0007497CEC|nr:metallophosphoesterase [Streptomyces sp. NRRL F-4489]KUL33844.1 phosphatase [Streptomyces sp. NRRL F-4489]
MSRQLRKITATTDVHSAFDQAAPFLTHLHAARADGLIVDCGDFFEGTGYYRFGKGEIEREVLASLYDLLAPGNHGWPHYFEPQLHAMTVCANATDAQGEPLFDRLRITTIGDLRVAITAVISPAAFATIHADQRSDHRVTEPGQALRMMMLQHRHNADAWVVLSHSGFAADVELAAACPFADVIFSGHCHSASNGPVRIGSTLVVKGGELGTGYAVAEPAEGATWMAHTATFPDADSGTVPDELAGTNEKIAHFRGMLATPLGPVRVRYRGQFNRHHLLQETADRLHTGLGADGVILNETALRVTRLGDQLTLGDLLAIEPFDNQLVHAFLPNVGAADLYALRDHLTDRVGPLAIAPDPLPPGIRSVLTTHYLADTYLGGRTHQAGLPLGQAVRSTLTTPLPDEQQAGAR